MLGQRKKTHKEDLQQKKKWQLEYNELEDEAGLGPVNIDPKEIPKQDSDEENSQKIQENVTNQAQVSNEDNKVPTSLNLSGEKKKKIYEWMDSSDELSQLLTVNIWWSSFVDEEKSKQESKSELSDDEEKKSNKNNAPANKETTEDLEDVYNANFKKLF